MEQFKANTLFLNETPGIAQFRYAVTMKENGNMHEGEDMTPKSVELRETDAGLTLVGDNMELRCDFEEMLPRIKPGRLQQELLVKAAKVK